MGDVGGAARAVRGGVGVSVPRYVAWLPRRVVSRLTGVCARLRLPPPLLAPLLGLYARGFGADLTEAARPLAAFRSFSDFFTRELRDGVRPLDPDPAAVLSPVDARVYMSGPVERGTVLQAKGVPYAVGDLLGDAADAARFEGGTFLTAYLAPKDYHRIHWPWTGALHLARHLPGDLWPVNDRALAGVPGLFARNERLALLGRTAAGADVALVPVGALNVGSIGLEGVALRTNRAGPRGPSQRRFAPPRPTVRGARAAWFDFGSAVVLLVSPAAGRLDPLEPGTVLRVGRRIGTLRTTSSPA